MVGSYLKSPDRQRRWSSHWVITHYLSLVQRDHRGRSRDICNGINLRHRLLLQLRARLHGSPRFINAVKSTKLNSAVERYCLHSSTNVKQAVDLKMAANELVREGVAVIRDYLNLLAPELLFLILAQPVYKMWIIQEPNNLELWDKLHFEEEKTESIYHV